MAYEWPQQTLSKAQKLAETVRPNRWLSLDGKILLKIIDLLATARDATETEILRAIQSMGQKAHWDMPNMNSRAEEYFLRWIITQRLAEKGL